MAVYESGQPVRLTKSLKTNAAGFLFLLIASMVTTTITNPSRLLDAAISEIIPKGKGTPAKSLTLPR